MNNHLDEAMNINRTFDLMHSKIKSLQEENDKLKSENESLKEVEGYSKADMIGFGKHVWDFIDCYVPDEACVIALLSGYKSTKP